MEEYLRKRSLIFNEETQFSCPDSCERYGCNEPALHVSVSLVDLIGISRVTDHRLSDLFNRFCKIGFDPLGRQHKTGRVSLELNRPCPFLYGKRCGVYSGRPIACALFPEAYFLVKGSESYSPKKIFQRFPCIQNPCFISSRRAIIIREMLEMYREEMYLSDFYLFGVSPFLVDLTNILGEVMEYVVTTEDGEARIPHHRIEQLLSHHFTAGEDWADWRNKINVLDRIEGVEDLEKMKAWTDQLASQITKTLPAIAYQFDGRRLQPIHVAAH